MTKPVGSHIVRTTAKSTHSIVRKRTERQTKAPYFNAYRYQSYGTVVGIEEVWETISPKNQHHISFSIVWQDWLGAKPKNVFRLTLNPSNEL